MKTLPLVVTLTVFIADPAGAQGPSRPGTLPEVPPAGIEFETPVRMMAGGEIVRTESPGYACPCWFDVDGDGLDDLVVGQFRKGRMKVYHNRGDGELATGEWIMIGASIAEVPGVW